MAKQTKGFSKFVLMAAFFSGAALLLPSLVSACTNCGICENPCQGINNCYFVEFNDYLQPIGHPQHISSMDASVNLPFSGDYDTTTCFYENSGAVQKYEEYNVFVDSVKIGSTEDPDVVGYYKQNLSEHNFSSGNHIVKVEHRWNFSEVINSQVTSQSAHVKNVVFVLMSANNPPYANAGPDKTVNETQTVILDGSGSYDPDGDAITYSWVCAAGTLSNSTVAKPTYTAPSVSSNANYTCTLTVTDAKSATDSDLMTVTVKDTTPQINIPAVETNSASNITTNNAVLNGNLTDLGGDVYADVNFEWGKTSSYGSTTQILTKTSTGSFNKTIYGLESATTYHFRAKAQNSAGAAFGADKTFKTAANSNNPPVANAGPDKTVNETQTVILDGSGSYDPDGDTITYLWSCAGGTLSNNSVQKPLFNAPSVSADTNFTCALTVTDTYNATGSDFALIKVKNTSPNIEDPAVQTNPATNIDQDSAVLNGDLTDLGGDDAAEVWFEWGKTTSYSYTTSKQSKSSVGTFAKGISGLQSNTLYHFRAVAENESGIAYGVDKTFRTTADSDNEPPVADAGSNKTVDEGEEIRLDGTGSYDPDGDDLEYDWTCQSGSLAYQDTERPRYTAPYVNNDRDYICTLTVTDEHGENDSDDVKITVANTDTNNEPVELQTESATSIGETQATLRGTLSNLGDNDSVAVWFEWGKTTSYGKETAEQTKTSTGLWSKVITGLSEDTTYHFRAIGRGEDDNDIVYGQDKTFTTLGQENDNGPVADAGPDKTVNEGEQVRLDGSGSYDPDNGDIDYYWTCASGTLSSRTVERPYYTAPEITGHKTYTCTLKVTDEDGLTDTDEANVAVNDDENQTSDLIDIKKQAMNLSRGDTAWSDAVIASSSDVLKFQITITSTADETLEDLTVKDELPSRLIYQGNLKINNESSSLNITNGINVGDLEKNETIIITFLAMVASKENFVYGSTDLINTILVYNGDTSETGICKIIVKKSSASDIPTGITNNFFLDSILFPLLSSMFLIWAFRSRLIGLDKAMDQRKKEIVKYRTEKELAKKINKIKNKII